MAGDDEAEWAKPGARGRGRFSWSGLLWSLIFPQRGQRILPTAPGLVLIALSFGIGTAAYNSSSNILFITLSLLLTCLILSGVLSSLNLRGVRCRLVVSPALRAGHDTIVALELRNRKRFLPTYGLWFEFAARTISPGVQRAESTVSAKLRDVRAALAKSEAEEMRARVALTGRLDPAGESRVEWVLRPASRGRLRVELASVGSLFPFGFLRKEVGTALSAEAIVWPAPVEYRRDVAASRRRSLGGERMARAGTGGDLLALRRYSAGDSHRLIHWKASARVRTLLVRQYAAESAEGYSIWLRTEAGLWPHAEQFELLIRFAAVLAEDLFRDGQLIAVALNAGAARPIRRLHDLERWLDDLALAEPLDATEPRDDNATDDPLGRAKHHVITFVPEGARGVAALVEGQRVAAV